LVPTTTAGFGHISHQNLNFNNAISHVADLRGKKRK
jgi:hypothetical protein